MSICERTQDHVVQFYRTDEFLAGVLAPFMTSGVREAQPILAVCTAEHLAAVDEVLQGTGSSILGMTVEGKLVWKDARELLRRLDAAGAVSDAAFQREIGEVVGAMCDAAGARRPQIYGELVDLLWAQGRQVEAIRLEGLWNTLASKHDFNLLCSYQVPDSNGAPAGLHGVCSAHTHVLRPENPIGVNVLEDPGASPMRLGEREMVRASRLRDQQIAAGLREDLAQNLFGLMLKGQGLKAQAPAVSQQLDDLILSLDRALHKTLTLADEVAPPSIDISSLAGSVLKYAAITERLLKINCAVSIGESFREPEPLQRELVYSLIRGIVDRIAHGSGARDVLIKLSRRAKRQQLAISHDGADLVLFGARDDSFRRLLYQAHAMDNDVELLAVRKGPLQFRCAWLN